MLKLHNVRIKPSNMRKKVRKPPNVRKELSHVILKLHNVRMEPSNVRKKVREPPNVIKKTVTCDKKTVTYNKNRTDAMLELLNITMEPSNLRKKINKGTTIYDKIIVKCDIETAQCEDGTVKYEKKVRKPPNVRKELSYVMLELHNMRMKSSNVRKKKKRNHIM